MEEFEALYAISVPSYVSILRTTFSPVIWSMAQNSLLVEPIARTFTNFFASSIDFAVPSRCSLSSASILNTSNLTTIVHVRRTEVLQFADSLADPKHKEAVMKYADQLGQQYLLLVETTKQVADSAESATA
jgi:hypothetical protein